MSKIWFTQELAEITPDMLEGFFVGWLHSPSPQKHLQILQNSYRVWLAMHNNKCIGFINAISDNVFYAHIPLLEVLPEYRGKGIGSELVERMLESLSHMYAIDFICDEKTASFYEKLGLKKCTAMVRRNYHRQKGE